ncbi:glycosyltransferase family 2 protein [Cytobacillus firmus]|uniref:glycosyltransferase family 2 protein n=1 Tax=Cytobacillus firmus TaxID=1399 RepID=UPI0021623B8D|nr:glycosyltransferase family 2 protein [Cytobacillus firmus]MCS0674055.1 glycosyltransferase [Cytobacillus firmus]
MKEISPLVSVILTSYNKPLTIGKAIESVLNQTYTNWELFIMDDNSKLETVNVIKTYITDSRISYINSQIKDNDRYKTTRYATLINQAISKTRGKYITYLTDDNIFYPDRLRTMVHFLEQKRVDIAYSKQQVKWIDDSNGEIREGIRRTYGVIKNAAGLVDHCSVMHTRAIAEEVFRKYGSYWDDNAKNWNYGDAAFWNRLTEFRPFYPIRMILDLAWKGHDSFQMLYTNMPSSIPNGTLVRGLSDDVFLIDLQLRRKIHPQTFIDLKYDPKNIVRIPDPFLFKYQEGNTVDSRVFNDFSIFPNQRLISSERDTSVYYIQNNKKHLIKNDKAFEDYKFNKEYINLVSNCLWSGIPEGQPIEELNKNISILPDGVLYKIQNHFYISLNNCLHLIEENVVKKLKLPFTDPVILESGFLTRFKQGEPFVWVN